MDKYMEVNIDTTGIKDIDRDGGVSIEEIGKMATFGYAAEQCGIVENEKENSYERV